MKLLVATLFLVYLACYEAVELTAEQKEKLKEHFKACSGVSGVTVDALGKVEKGEFPKDPKLNKFFGCMYKRIGLMNDNGEFQIDVMKAKIPKDVKSEVVDKLIEDCKGTKGEDADETAYLLFKCYHEKSPEHIQFW